ncbi:MAG TPA: hypothetical protein VGN17_08130 [Bryobacteraceae bacterium]|jgi:hypothetical protein
MRDETLVPQINVSRIRVDGNIAGAIFAVGSLAIGLVGIPSLWPLALGAVVVGGGVALALRLVRGT